MPQAPTDGGRFFSAHGSDNDQQRAQIKADERQWLAQVDDNIKAYEATYLVDDEVRGLKAWHAAYPAYLAARAKTIELFDAHRDAEAVANRDGDAAQKLTAASAALDGLLTVQDTTGAQMNRDVAATADVSIKVLLATIVGALLLGAGIGLWLARSISSGVGQVARAAEGLAEGDLEQSVDVRSRDEVGAMAARFRDMIDYQKSMAGVARAITDRSAEVRP